MLREMQRRDATPDQRRMSWLLWANTVANDLHHRRGISFPPPEEMKGDWEYVKELIDRLRKPRSQLRSSELALLMDVGDYCLQQRALETANAATLECLIHAAWLLWDANGRTPNAAADSIYDHIANEWETMPPPLESLPEDRGERFQMCLRWMREDDLIPDWFFFGQSAPKDDRDDAPEVAGVLGDV